MKIKYKNSLRDIINFQIYALKLFPNNVVLILAPLSITFSSMDFNDFHINTIIKFVVMFIIFFLLIYLIGILFALLFTVVNMNSKRSKMNICEHKINFEDERMIEETDYNKSEFKYEGIIKYKETKHYILIFISRVQAHIIPKRDLELIEIEEIIDVLKLRNISNK